MRILIRILRRIFTDRIRTGDNRVIGPGYRVYYTTKFSWGKLSFVLFILLLLFVIIYLFF